MKLKLFSEFGTIKKVLMLRPGKEIERLTPENTSELLFEDVPYLEAMQKEHDEYASLIRSSTDVKLYHVRQLLLDILRDADIRKSVIEKVLKKNSYPELCEDILSYYSTAETVTLLIAGLTVREMKIKSKIKVLHEMDDREYLIPPSPNFYFMRDPSAVVQTGVINSNMKYSGRQVESTLIRAILKNHYEFKEAYQQVFPSPKHSDTVPTIEGGDVLVVSKKVLAIGRSERTESEAIRQVAEAVLSEGTVERVYEVSLPRRRNYMHLDTVFSIIDENLVLTYSEAMSDIGETAVYRFNKKSDGTGELHKEQTGDSLITILKKEIRNLEVVETGYGFPEIASREQWYDGANVFAIGPRRVISYDRNKLTNRALRDRGVEVIETRSSELSRGLGGPRCMTLPVEREDI
jgi:arginine deiminase